MMENKGETALARSPGVGITRASLSAIAEELDLFEEFVKKVLRKDEDYSKLPGTDKYSLRKPGAANIIAAFCCHAEPHLEKETLDLEKGLVFYRYKVNVVHNESGEIRASGQGSCSSYEEKYRYRTMERICPLCEKPAIIKGKVEFGGGWICWKKKDGCGAKFDDGVEVIEGQPSGKRINEDFMEQANTILKMAIKRAASDAALQLPGVARFFTQDLDEHEEETKQGAERSQPPREEAKKQDPQTTKTQAPPASRSETRPQVAQPSSEKEVQVVASPKVAPGQERPSQRMTAPEFWTAIKSLNKTADWVEIELSKTLPTWLKENPDKGYEGALEIVKTALKKEVKDDQPNA